MSADMNGMRVLLDDLAVAVALLARTLPPFPDGLSPETQLALGRLHGSIIRAHELLTMDISRAAVGSGGAE